MSASWGSSRGHSEHRSVHREQSERTVSKFNNSVEKGAARLEPNVAPCYQNGHCEAGEAIMGGVFIAIDGIDGAGKTTLALALARIFEGQDPLVTKEPTSESPWGKELRRSAERGRFSRDKEIEYFHKDRLYHIETIIIPALKQNRLVITDRYVDSTLAFQAVDADEAEEMWLRFQPQILTPDVSFILRCPVAVGLERIRRSRNHITTFETSDALERARHIYESRRGEHYCPLDAHSTPEHTLAQALVALSSRFTQLTSDPFNMWDSIPSEFDRDETMRAAAEYKVA